MMNKPLGPPPQLPPLRKGITFAFDDYDVEGKPQWLIHDPGRNKFFLIGWKEYEILSRWQPDPMAIIASINSQTTMQVDMQDIEQFLEFLTRHFLTQLNASQVQKLAEQQHIFKQQDSIVTWLIHHYLFFRIPLWHPDNFLNRTKEIGNILFSKYTLLLMLILGFIALFQLSVRWEIFVHTFSTIFTWQGLIFYMIGFLFCKFCHELGHAYMCKSYGVPVPSFGIAFLVFWPVFYTDTTLSWALNYKKRRNIALAGILVETYVTIFAILIWCNIQNQTLQAICYLIVAVNWIASLLINVSPFMRFDGYYVLADTVRMPNLQPRAFALTRWQIRKWLFDWEDPPPEKFTTRMHYFLVFYSILTWLYRLVLYLGIAVLVYHFFIKLVGIILFVIEIYYFVLMPIIGEIRVWLHRREEFTLNVRTSITIIGALILLLLLFMPISESVNLPATVSYAHQFLFANNAGVLENPLPPPGTKVKANQILATINSPDLKEAMKELVLNYRKNLSDLRRAQLVDKYSAQKAILQSDIDKQNTEYEKLKKLQDKLVIKAPFDGVIVDTPSDIDKGTFLSKGEWLGDIVNPKAMQIEAFVSQMDANRVKLNAVGYFYPQDLESKKIPVRVISVEPLNTRELTCHFAPELYEKKTPTQIDIAIETPCYHASDLGGGIATYLTDKGEYVPTNSTYRVLLTTDKPVDISFIERGTVILRAESASIFSRFLYKVKSIWVQQSSF